MIVVIKNLSCNMSRLEVMGENMSEEEIVSMSRICLEFGRSS